MAGIFQKIECEKSPNKVFVLMPFADEFDAIYRLIHRCCQEQGLECVRADEDLNTGKITDKIYYHIKSSGIIIADLTGRNANVFYELGLAHAVSNKVILLTQSIPEVPFDLRDFSIIEYSNSFSGSEDLANKLSKLLDGMARSVDFEPGENPELNAMLEVELPNDLDLEDFDFGIAHLHAEISRSTGNMQEARDWLERAKDAAIKGLGEAPQIGNCAIEAERCNFLPLAEELYKLALEADPLHINNRQSYVSFLLDHRSRSSSTKDIAKAILDDLELLPERQERTLALKAQFVSTFHKSASGSDLDSLIEELVGDGDFRSLEEAIPLLIALQEAKRYQEFRDVVENLRENSEDVDTTTLDRALADAFAQSGDNALQDEAVNIFRQLLSDETGDDSPDVKHNLATLLSSRRSGQVCEEAENLWRQAYEQKPSDMAIRRAFAQCLLRHKKGSEAEKVLAGQPIKSD